MTVLPIVGRELRVASRKAATYWMRFGAAFLAIGLFTFVFLAEGNYTPSSQLAKIIFVVLSCLFFFLALITGILNTADCISEERREGTLGLLFLTDLRGYDVTIGKLVANSLHAFFSLLATFPILALPLLMGGVNKATVWVVLMVLANTLFFALCMGIFISVFCKSPVKSITLAFLLVLFFTFGIPLVAMILHEYRVITSNTIETMCFLSPGYAVVQMFDSIESVMPVNPNVYLSTAILHAISWAALLVVTFWLPRSWKDKSSVKKNTPLRSFFNSGLKGGSAARRNYRTRMLDINPAIWLGRRDRSKGLMLWGIFALVAVCWLWGYLENRGNWLEIPVAIMFGIALHTIVRFVLIVESCRQLHEDRKSGALELLFSTPLSVHGLVSGLGNAMTRSYGYQFLFVLLVDFVLIIVGMNETNLNGDEEVLAMIFCGIGVFVLDCFLIRWIGLWIGLNFRVFAFAIAAVSGIIFALPWITFFLTALILALSGVNMGDDSGVILLWTAINVGIVLLFALICRQKLYSKLRVIATQPQSRSSRRSRKKQHAESD